ncbi:unnamed protein product [Caenorhabditis angaria]|uniref:Uncharacterized protein n=1 Tax=Caenorhabditis angaria TaxID=860376 RepID=A0A9P1N7I3_9PELO|nr:unnamed protein product [Caenorhabditis angaria]
MQTILLSSYSGIHCFAISFIAVQFIFRYWTLKSSDNLRLFDGYRLYFWVAYCALMGVLWVTIADMTILNDKFAVEFYRDKISEVYELSINDLPAYIFVAYEPGAHKIPQFQINTLICIVSLTSLIIIQYLIMIYCAIGMRSIIKKKLTNLSKSQRKLQKQFYKALMFQTCASSFMIHLPFICLFVLPYFNFQNIAVEASFLITTVSAYPLIDTLIILLVIGEYKKVIVKLFVCL